MSNPNNGKKRKVTVMSLLIDQQYNELKAIVKAEDNKLSLALVHLAKVHIRSTAASRSKDKKYFVDRNSFHVIPDKKMPHGCVIIRIDGDQEYFEEFKLPLEDIRQEIKRLEVTDAKRNFGKTV